MMLKTAKNSYMEGPGSAIIKKMIVTLRSRNQELKKDYGDRNADTDYDIMKGVEPPAEK